MGGRLSALGAHCRRALKLLEECSETFRHGLFQGRVFDLEESSDCQQPRSSGQDERMGFALAIPFANYEGGPTKANNRLTNARDPELPKRGR
jgi:hypothetical protein